MSTIISKRVNIKLVGSWNSKIFKPAWVLDNLSTDSVKLSTDNIQISFDIETSAIIYSLNESLHLLASDKTVEVNFIKPTPSEDDLIFGTELVLKIIKLLPQTPIIATGFNVVYEIANPNKAIPFYDFLVGNSDAISDFKLYESRFRKKLDGYSMNVIISNKNESQNQCSVNFNFNYPHFFNGSKETFFKHYQYTNQLINY